MQCLVSRIALIPVVLWLSACEPEQPSIEEIAEFSANQVLVNQTADEAFLKTVGECHLYENYNYRQIDDGRTDALADTNNGHFRIVLVGGSFDAFAEQYDEKTMSCVGELPPFDTIWVLSSGDKCGLVEDESDGARAYGIEYSNLVMEKLISERECR